MPRNLTRIIPLLLMPLLPLTLTHAQPLTECSTGAVSQFAPGTPGEVTAADGLALYAEPTTDSQTVYSVDAGTSLTVWHGGLCNDDGLWWFAEVGFIMGWLTETTPSGDYLVAPVSAPVFDAPRPRAGDNPLLVDDTGLQFSLSADIAGTATTNWVPANTDELNPQSQAHPTYRNVTFDGYAGSQQEFWLYVRVHPAEEWESLTGLTLDDLRTQLNDRPNAPYLTGLPGVGAARYLEVNPTYVDFQNGGGVRALVQYTQSGAPVVDGELIYLFAGLTDDRAYLVHAAFALDSTLLPSDAARDERFDFDAYLEYQIVSDNAFQTAISSVLSAAPDETFTPHVSDLDALVASLRVEAPELCGEVPSLLAVGDTVQQALEGVPLRVRDSANGTMTNSFYPGEEAVIVAGPECIDGIVWWDVFREGEWGGWVAELEDDTYYLTEIND